MLVVEMTCKSQANMFGKEAQFGFKREKYKFTSHVYRNTSPSYLITRPKQKRGLSRSILKKANRVVRAKTRHSR